MYVPEEKCTVWNNLGADELRMASLCGRGWGQTRVSSNKEAETLDKGSLAFIFMFFFSTLSIHFKTSIAIIIIWQPCLQLLISLIKEKNVLFGTKFEEKESDLKLDICLFGIA